MPGSVANAVATTVMPLSLSKMFRHSRLFPLIENEYKNGESQRSLLASTSRKAWETAKRLAPTPLETLRSFHEARKGSTEAFYFYDPFQTSPLFAYDPTGVATTGRYTVRFDGDWQQTVTFPRVDVSIRLIQVA